MRGEFGRRKNVATRLCWLLCLSMASTLGALLSPLGDAGRRMRTWAEAERARLNSH